MVIDGRVIRPYGGRLTVEEVAVLLGVPRRADGRYYLKDICTAAAINIWSARKPVRNSLKNGNLTLDDFKAANYGFDLVSILSTASTLPSLAPLVGAAGISAQGSWNSLYRTPRGRLSQYVCEWLRLLDFNGYYHYAAPPYDSITPSASAGRIGGIRVFRNSDAAASEIALEDLTGIRDTVPGPEEEWDLSARNKVLGSWTYYDLRQKIEAKAEEAGISVRSVQPANTSRRCSACGFIAKENRPSAGKAHQTFCCIRCGFTTDADHNAAINLSVDNIEEIIRRQLEAQKVDEAASQISDCLT